MTNKEIKYGDSGEAKNKEIIRVDSPEGFIVEAVKGRVSVVGLEPRQEPVDSGKVGLKRGKGKNDPREKVDIFFTEVTGYTVSGKKIVLEQVNSVKNDGPLIEKKFSPKNKRGMGRMDLILNNIGATLELAEIIGERLPGAIIEKKGPAAGMDNEKLRKIRGGNVIPSVIFQRNPAVNAPRIA